MTAIPAQHDVEPLPAAIERAVWYPYDILDRDGAETVHAWIVRAVMATLQPTLDELGRFRQHSITLNTVAFKLAEALGDVPPGQDWTVGNPIEQAERLTAELQRARAELAVVTGERDDAMQVLADLTDFAQCEHDHHGNCQAHGWLQDSECANARALKLIAPAAGASLAELTEAVSTDV